MRSRRRSPKGGVQAEKQQRYVQLIAQGINNTEACRIVGIDRKTGNRWRYGRSIRNSVGERVHYPPVKIEERRPRSPRYLSEDERVMIADLLAVGDGVRAIGRKLGRVASTISREIRRNRDKDERYRPHGTLVERATRFVILLGFPDAVGSAEAVGEAIGKALERLPEGLRRTLTWDQGKELALIRQISTATAAGVFFCEAHSPWQRGSNENMNGLLRDYFPKGSDLSVHTVQDLTRVAVEVNERPRKTLGWQRPADLFHAAIAAC